MNDRITFISTFNQNSLEIIKNYTKDLNEKLCKVPFGKNVSNREEADTLPFHFTLSAWNIKEKDNIITKLSQIRFSKLAVLVNDIEIMKGKENSYVLYFNIEENKSLKKLHQKIYEILPSEKYNPSTFKFHITIHIDKDYAKINSMKQKLLENFTPFKLEVDTFALYQIYPAKIVKQFSF